MVREFYMMCTLHRAAVIVGRRKITSTSAVHSDRHAVSGCLLLKVKL